MNKQQKAFTLIELMIVLAIVGILASLALPTYQDYTIRSQIAEGLSLAGPAQAALVTYTNDHGTFPADNDDAGIEIPANYRGKYTSSVAINGSIISIVFGNSAHQVISGNSVTLTALRSNGSVSWQCDTAGVVPQKYLPKTCL